MEKAERSDIADIDKKKYLVPTDLTVGQFVYVVRKRIKLNAEKVIFVFINNTLPPNYCFDVSIYEENKDQDGFLSFPLLCLQQNLCPVGIKATIFATLMSVSNGGSVPWIDKCKCDSTIWNYQGQI